MRVLNLTWLALACALVSSVVQAQLRPQLSAAQAASHRASDYLAQGATPWIPPAFADASRWTPDFNVAADGSGSHHTVQAAVDAVPAGGGRRYFIRVVPGLYRERLCVAAGKSPITLYGSPGQAAAVLIVGSAYNALPNRPGVDAAHPCTPDLAAASHGTPGSASVVIASDDFHAAHLSIANDSMDAVNAGIGYPPGAGESGGAQGVALLTQADRVLLDDVRLIGHQDTFFARRSDPTQPARVLVRASLIAGDVDFIFGNATLVIDDSTILSRAGRRTPPIGGHVLAPSTAFDQRLGFLVQRSRFVAEAGIAPGSISLGRAWDVGVAAGNWAADSSPNGQALVRDSAIGPHLTGWAASTSRRPFSPTGPQANRLVEFANTALPASPEREVLAPRDGWASAEGGTRGGADAAAADVFDVHSRQALVQALSGPARPRIVRVHGQIDLASDATGKPLAADDFRDPAFNWADFARAYDPATWGRRDPEGALEQARKRSAQRQAAHVAVSVPSRTTLIGMGTGAHIVNGMLLLDKVEDIIIRNLHFSDAYDFFPAWEPRDNGHGEWNSEYDNVSLRNASHVWIDHCTFDDGDRPDAAEPHLLNRPMQRHDGLVDITRQSNFITVSWNHFRQHDKTTLVGAGDGQSQDDGRLKVTFHHNFWEDVHERSPRVRYGQVHSYNNLHLSTSAAHHGYFLGVGFMSRLYSQPNVFETPPEIGPGRLTKLWRGTAFVDRGSLHNGQPVDLLSGLRGANPGAQIAGDVGWSPELFLTVDPAGEVASRVRGGAGAGRLSP